MLQCYVPSQWYIDRYLVLNGRVHSCRLLKELWWLLLLMLCRPHMNVDPNMAAFWDDIVVLLVRLRWTCDMLHVTRAVSRTQGSVSTG